MSAETSSSTKKEETLVEDVPTPKKFRTHVDEKGYTVVEEIEEDL